MAKKVTFRSKPTSRPTLDADDWVSRGQAHDEPPPKAEPKKAERPATTRYTIDIPTTLHRQIKSKCAERGVKMNEEIIRLFEKHFGGD